LYPVDDLSVPVGFICVLAGLDLYVDAFVSVAVWLVAEFDLNGIRLDWDDWREIGCEFAVDEVARVVEVAIALGINK
jgi:hypothetical protein